MFYSFSNRYQGTNTERCVRIISNSKGQCISSEANSSSSSQESTRILQRPIFHRRIQIIPVLARSTQYTSPPIDSIKTDFNIILLSILMFFKWSFYLQISSPEHRIYLFSSPTCCVPSTFYSSWFVKIVFKKVLGEDLFRVVVSI